MTIKTLDWKTDELFGWEEGRHLLLVEALRLGIRHGDKIPPFEVVQIGINSYIINSNPSNKNNGGHHRAIAHYLEKKNPLIELVECSEQKKKQLLDSAISIDKIDLFDYRNISNKSIKRFYEEQFWYRARGYPKHRSNEIFSQSQ